MDRQDFSDKSTKRDTDSTGIFEDGGPEGRGPDSGPGSKLAGESAFGMSRAQLMESYRAVIQSKAIYYPVAYRFLGELGRGRQGIVFLGLRQGARGCITRHAIKVYDPGIYASAAKYWTDMGRIASQISRLQSVRSPALVARDAYEESNGVGYVQMEAIEGVELRSLLDPKKLVEARKHCTEQEWAHFADVIFRIENGLVTIQPGVAIYILRRILRALETLHEHGFVHADVKPENTMIDQLGYVKLIDYGRASHIGEEVKLLLGTPYYMAPETHRREISNSQSDLYSVGILGIEMLCGRPLFHTRNEAELLRFKLELPDRMGETLPAHVQESEFLTELLCGLIHPDPRQRSASIGEAEGVEQAFAMLHRELVRMDVDADYGRELEDYLAKLRNSGAKQIEMSRNNLYNHQATNRKR